MRGARLVCFLFCFLVSSFFIFSAGSAVHAAPNGPSIAIKFAIEEPNVGNGLDETSEVEGAAGVLQTVRWNNLEGYIGGPDTLFADVAGDSVDTNTTVEWVSANTWSSDGRTGEDINDLDEGWDRNLMLGYLDTDADNPAIVTIDDLDDAFTSNGYDVYVYILGGVLDRGGDYSIGDITFEHTVVERFDGTFIEGEEGNYVVFENLTDSTFDLYAQPMRGGTRRAPINAIEIVARTGGGGMRGDFNGDGVLDATDIDDLTQQSAGLTNPAAYDLNGDSLVDANDVSEWISAADIYKSWVGDANLDHEFNSSDLVVVLAAGTYETGAAAVWTTGDFNGDGVSNSSDLVAALSGGGYEIGPQAAVAAVPEPSTALLCLGLGAALLAQRRRR